MGEEAGHRYLLPIGGLNMRKLLFCLFILIAWHTPADAGFLKDKVNFADLAQLSAEGLEALKETEFEVFLANVELARAKDVEKRVEGELERAKHTLKTKELDLKAAKAEYEAAKANQDEGRIKKAEEAVKRAREDVESAELRVKWKQKVVKARSVAVKKAKLAVDLAEAKRDLARVSRLAMEKATSAKKYSMKDYQDRVRKIQEKYEAAAKKERRQIQDAEQLKAQYEKIAGHQ
jgi:hypothetical protein